MRNFFSSFFKFVLFAGVFYILMIILWGEFSPIKKNLHYKLGAGGHAFERLKEVKSAKDIDLLFLGSSHTYRGFDNRFYSSEGFSSFNLGTNSQTPLQTEYLLEKYLDSLNPKIIVLEVCPLIMSLDGVESTLEIISNTPIDSKIINLAIEQNHLKIYNTLIFGLFREFIIDDKNKYRSNKNKLNDKYVKGGFVEKQLKFYNQRNFKSQLWSFNPKLFHAFENIIDTLNERKIRFILIQSPVTRDFYKSYLNNKDFDKILSGYGKYYNFNELIKLNDTIHFVDYHHLNQVGVQFFNNEVLKILKELEASNTLN